MSNMMRVSPLAVLIALLALSTDSLGDYGKGFLVVRCDSEAKTFEVQPLIVWNERYDVLRSALRKSRGRLKRADGLFISVDVIHNTEESCRIGSARLTVRIKSIHNPVLELFKDQELIAAPVIGDVWWFHGYRFRVRYSPDKGWEEICGREEEVQHWRPLDHERTTTNCRVIQ
ncbi:MAG TPA: hypothetical protein VED01_03860 [Burkholderiales bacterium]|nr:hypothetical protein [Burkholderiales bacterium]